METDRARLDALEQHLWGDLWDAAPRDLAQEHGVEMRRFGPVQVTLIADLPRAGWQNLVLGAAAPGAVAGGHLEEAVGWADSLRASTITCRSRPDWRTAPRPRSGSGGTAMSRDTPG